MAAVNSADSDTERLSSLAHSKTDIRTPPALVWLRGYTGTCDVLKGLSSVHFYTFAAERNLWLRVMRQKMGLPVPCPRTATTLAKQQRRCSKWQRPPPIPPLLPGLFKAPPISKTKLASYPRQ